MKKIKEGLVDNRKSVLFVCFLQLFTIAFSLIFALQVNGTIDVYSYFKFAFNIPVDYVIYGSTFIFILIVAIPAFKYKNKNGF